jgi:hypothetical protein
VRPAPHALLLAVAALTSCDTSLEPQFLVKDLRVLAVRSQVVGSALADASVGDVVALEVLVANPRGRAGLRVTWYGCLPAGDESLPPCADPTYLSAPERLAAEAASGSGAVLGLGACAPSPGDGRCGIAVAVPPEIRPAINFVVGVALDEPAFACRLYADMPVVAVVEAEGKRELAVKRVRLTPLPEDVPESLRETYVRNRSPAVVDVRRIPTEDGSCSGGADVAPGTPFPAGSGFLCGRAAAESIQTFNVCDPEGIRTVHEDLDWQWYATDGEFPEFDGIGNATGTPVEFVRPAGPFTLWAILRDGRGGEDWLRRDFGPAP